MCHPHTVPHRRLGLKGPLHIVWLSLPGFPGTLEITGDKGEPTATPSVCCRILPNLIIHSCKSELEDWGVTSIFKGVVLVQQITQDPA